jgi:hypothetical protein
MPAFGLIEALAAGDAAAARSWMAEGLLQQLKQRFAATTSHSAENTEAFDGWLVPAISSRVEWVLAKYNAAELTHTSYSEPVASDLELVYLVSGPAGVVGQDSMPLMGQPFICQLTPDGWRVHRIGSSLD